MELSSNTGEIAIVGAGLGGLATAIALRKQGINVQIYDKARELRPVGAGLSLFPNGLNSLEAIAPGIVQYGSVKAESQYLSVKLLNSQRKQEEM